MPDEYDLLSQIEWCIGKGFRFALIHPSDMEKFETILPTLTFDKSIYPWTTTLLICEFCPRGQVIPVRQHLEIAWVDPEITL